MLKLQVDDELLGTLIQSVVPLVREYTAWDLRKELLVWRVIPRERGFSEIFLGRLRGAGIPVDGHASPTLNQRLMEYQTQMGVLAAYEPSRSEVLVIRENVNEANIDGLRLILAHELVHRAQHVRFPQLFERIDEIMRNLWYVAVTYSWVNPVRERAMLDDAMSVLESHAAYVQELIMQERYPLARITAPCDASGLVLRMLNSGKTSQYTRALPAVSEAARLGAMDKLYQKLVS